MPFLPFGTDAAQSFLARVKYIDFKNGKGVFYLTQFDTEPSLVNNQGLLYTFQGLTGDGLYYVSARFPVRVPFLPPSYDSKEFRDSTLPSYFYGADIESKEQRYRTYLTNITRELEEMPPDKFDPTLSLLEEAIRTLRVAVEQTEGQAVLIQSRGRRSSCT